MKHLYLISIALVLLSCGRNAEAPEGIVLSWGDTDFHYDVYDNPVRLSEEAFRYPAWRGEKTSAEAVLWSESGLSDVRVSVSDLRGSGGTIPKDAVSASFMKYVWADTMIDGYNQCGYRPAGVQDSVLVADMIDIADKADVPAGCCQPVWVSVRVPSDAKAGLYRGTLSVMSRETGRMSLPLELEVADRCLPEPSDWQFHLDLWQNPYSVARWHGVEPWSEQHFMYMRPVMKMLAEAGQKTITATIIDRPWNGQTEDAYGSMVTKTRNPDGSWTYGYEIFDKWVEFMMSLGIDRQISCYSLIPWRLQFDWTDAATGRTESLNAEPGSAEYEEYWGSFISDFAAHLREKGWFEKTVIAMDERPAEAMAGAFKAIRAVEPEFRVSLAGNWHPEIEDGLYDYCVGFRFDMPSEVKERRRSENKVSTWYTCCAERYPNIFTVSPPEEAVWIPWYTLAKGYDGYLRWAYNHWTADPMRDTRFRTWTAGDCYCIYPEGRSSVRFEKLVEGIQDYEKARIMMEEWRAKGLVRRLEKFGEILSEFDYEKISSEGAAPAVRKAKAFLNAPAVFFDTDIGSDIDDVLALQMLLEYERKGLADIECITLSKCNPHAAEFTDGYLRWNGMADIPLGFAYDGKSPENFYYLLPSLNAEHNGRKILEPAENIASDIPEGYIRLRRSLAAVPDNSVTVITVGHLTNIARLLESGPDDISPLSGVDLVRRKVKSLYMMGGDFSGSGEPECNIVTDCEASRTVFLKWPADIVACGFEIGCALPYPAESVMKDFGDIEEHPLCIAYYNWGTMPYDRPSWDPATVLAAMEPDAGYFSYSPAGLITVDENGATSFRETRGGRHRFLSLAEKDRGRVLNAIISRVTGK